MTRTIFISIFFALLGIIPRAAHADDRVMQFIIDPFNPDQAWMLTETNLQYNPQLKAQGKWETRFDKATFSRVTGMDPGAGYKHKKIQASKGKVGHLYLLVENTDGFGANKSMYIFATTDYGESWKYTVMGGKRAPAPAKVTRKKAGEKPAADEGGGVDLNALNDEGDKAEKGGGGNPHGGGGPSAGGPIFKVLFDLLLHLRSNLSPLTFDNYHTFLLADVIPRPEIHFMFEVNPSPRFYELDYQVSPRLTVRGGRIFIPFDEMDPHNSFGGRFNTSLLAQPNSAAFLPDLWTDLGLGIKYQLVDSKDLNMYAHFYVVNGFQSGGTDPVTDPSIPNVGNKYPNFASAPNPDNNTDKAVGLRLHGDLFGTVGLGLSFYTARYTKDTDLDGRIIMVGFDTQLRITSATQFNLGYIYQNVSLPGGSGTSFLRGGLYADLSQKLADRWKLIVRAGTSQNDNRVTQISDQTLLGGRLVYDLGLFKFSFEYFHDLTQVVGKTNYDYTALRAVVLF